MVKRFTSSSSVAATSLVLLLACSAPSYAQSSSDMLYYDVGGAAPFSISAGRGHRPSELGLGVRWNADARCGNFNIGATVSNQLNGLTNGFQNLMGNVVQNAKGAVASLPAMIIQRAHPQLYDLLSNGVLQGRVDYDKTKLSCQSMAEQMADMAMGEGMQQRAMAENWQDTAMATDDAVAAQEVVDEEAGNDGTTWVGGEKRGGRGQDPIRVVEDVAQAGYNILHGRSDPNSNESVSGGGGGWGSVSTDDGTWPGGGGLAGSAGGGSGDCDGGMCTVWGSPTDAAEWTRSVIGDTEIRVCDDCEKIQGQAGTGLVTALEEEQEEIRSKLVDLVSGASEPSPSNLREVSGGSGLVVSRGVIESLQSDPDAGLLVQRLSGEMAMARTLTKAIWARRLLLAGSSEPGVSGNSEAVTALDRKLQSLNRDIDALQSEMEIRQALANNAANMALQRSTSRKVGNSVGETTRPEALLDNRGRPIEDEEE